MSMVDLNFSRTTLPNAPTPSALLIRLLMALSSGYSQLVDRNAVTAVTKPQCCRPSAGCAAGEFDQAVSSPATTTDRRGLAFPLGFWLISFQAFTLRCSCSFCCNPL
jgi:hypothetical protein